MSSNTIIVDAAHGNVRPQSSQASDQGAAAPEDWGARGHEAVMQIPVSVRIVIGTAKMPVSKLMNLTRGSMIPLDRKVGDLVDIVVNGRNVAKGEIVVVDQEADRFAVIVRQVVRANEDQ
jgi:flagellar motor switch protein FliN/FliY